MQPFNQTQIRQQLSQIAKRFYQTLLQLHPDHQKYSNAPQRSVIVLKNSLGSPQQELKETLIAKPGQEEDQKRKRKYRFYSVCQKKMIIDEVKKQLSETKFSLASIIKFKSQQYGIHTKNISRWYKLEEIKEREGGRKPAFPQIQQKLIKYLCQNPDRKRRDVIQYAKDLYNQIQCEDKKRFIFSKGWYQRFKVRSLEKVVKYKQLVSKSLGSRKSENSENQLKVKVEVKEQE